MLNRLLGAALVFCVPGLAIAKPPVQVPSEPSSMRFEWVQEGPAEQCGKNCREWIAASGPITADAVTHFDFFSKVKDVRGATLVLDSGGGSVLASLELGRKVRAFGMTTTVGRAVRIPGEDDRARLSPRGECASMCVFVLLGGAKRQVPAEARILVHQIWPGTKRYDASAESYTAEEMVRIQRDVGRIARYTVEMGADIELFELAMRIPPWERLRALSPGELRRMKLETIELMAEAPTSGATTTEQPGRMPVASAPERGWTLVENAKERMVARYHPLTLEGDEIGEFELRLACAQGQSSFALAYSETRNSDLPGGWLQDVSVFLDGERTNLKVDSSTSKAQGEMRSEATGVLSAKVLEKLRKDPGTAMVIGTRTSENVRTSIRVGGSGFAKVFPQLASRCGK